MKERAADRKLTISLFMGAIALVGGMATLGAGFYWGGG